MSSRSDGRRNDEEVVEISASQVSLAADAATTSSRRRSAATVDLRTEGTSAPPAQRRRQHRQVCCDCGRHSTCSARRHNGIAICQCRRLGVTCRSCTCWGQCSNRSTGGSQTSSAGVDIRTMFGTRSSSLRVPNASLSLTLSPAGSTADSAEVLSPSPPPTTAPTTTATPQAAPLPLGQPTQPSQNEPSDAPPQRR